MKFKILIIVLIVSALVLMSVAVWDYYWERHKEGEITVGDGYLVLDTDTSEGEIRTAEEGKEGILLLPPSRAVPLGFTVDDEDYIELAIVSENYETDKSFLMKVSVGGKQIGIVYFDKDEHIRFDGDKEKFERALLEISSRVRKEGLKK